MSVKKEITVEIVHWHPDDGTGIADVTRLVCEFGRPVEVDAMARRLSHLAARPADFPSTLLLARDTATGEVIGLLHAVIPIMIVMDATAEIWGLVVDSHHRGNRIGQHLMDAAEVWAREHGVTTMRLYTNVLRTDAHRFYERLGFERVKTSYTYTKTL